MFRNIEREKERENYQQLLSVLNAIKPELDDFKKVAEAQPNLKNLLITLNKCRNIKSYHETLSNFLNPEINFVLKNLRSYTDLMLELKAAFESRCININVDLSTAPRVSA